MSSSTLEGIGFYAMGREPRNAKNLINDFCAVHRKSVHRTCLRRAWHTPACLHFEGGAGSVLTADAHNGWGGGRGGLPFF